MKSIGQKLMQVSGLLGTKDLNAWENEFVNNVCGWTDNGKDTTMLTDKQAQVVERIYKKHFA